METIRCLVYIKNTWPPYNVSTATYSWSLVYIYHSGAILTPYNKLEAPNLQLFLLVPERELSLRIRTWTSHRLAGGLSLSSSSGRLSYQWHWIPHFLQVHNWELLSYSASELLRVNELLCNKWITESYWATLQVSYWELLSYSAGELLRNLYKDSWMLSGLRSGLRLYSVGRTNARGCLLSWH